MKGSPESCEAQQGGVIQSIPVYKMQWKEAVQLTRCLQKRYLMRHPFKIKLLSKAAFLFLILILFKANRAVSAPGNDTDCSKQGGLKLIYSVMGWPTLYCCWSDLARNTRRSSERGAMTTPRSPWATWILLSAGINQNNLHMTEACPGWDWVRPNPFQQSKTEL